MFVAVIFAHLLAVLFSFCGVVLLCAQFGGPRPESAAAFVSALVVSCTPLAIAGVIELLVQIAVMLEKLILHKEGNGGKAESTAKSAFVPVSKKAAEPVSASGQFFRSNPVPEPPAVEPLPEETSSPVEEQKPADSPQVTPKPEKKEPTLSFFRVD